MINEPISGTKVADLAIERREGHENYGIGSITNNDLTKLIDFRSALLDDKL